MRYCLIYYLIACRFLCNFKREVPAFGSKEFGMNHLIEFISELMEFIFML